MVLHMLLHLDIQITTGPDGSSVKLPGEVATKTAESLTFCVIFHQL